MCVTFEGAADPVLDFALRIVEVLADFNAKDNQNLQIRMGICTGSCFGGILGSRIPRFHIFGEAHDTSIKIEQNGVPGQIIVSASTYEISRDRYAYAKIPNILEDQDTYRLVGRVNTPPFTMAAIRAAQQLHAARERKEQSDTKVAHADRDVEHAELKQVSSSPVISRSHHRPAQFASSSS